jgi:flagellar hook-basal body complex protein FliE
MTDAIASVLSQIRALQSQTRVAAPSLEVGGAANGVGFAETLQRTLRTVNDTQLESRRLATAFEMGEPGVDMVKVMLAQQESRVAFQAVAEVRNRMVQAYQDVLNMPI